jgi:membrane associated rhomboid family serine protease
VHPSQPPSRLPSPVRDDDPVVIPVHDINPLRRTPWVTYALVAINVVVLLLTPVAIGTMTSQP